MGLWLRFHPTPLRCSFIHLCWAAAVCVCGVGVSCYTLRIVRQDRSCSIFRHACCRSREAATVIDTTMTIEFAMLAGTLLFFSKLHRFHCVADFHRIRPSHYEDTTTALVNAACRMWYLVLGCPVRWPSLSSSWLPL